LELLPESLPFCFLSARTWTSFFFLGTGHMAVKKRPTLNSGHELLRFCSSRLCLLPFFLSSSIFLWGAPAVGETHQRLGCIPRRSPTSWRFFSPPPIICHTRPIDSEPPYLLMRGRALIRTPGVTLLPDPHSISETLRVTVIGGVPKAFFSTSNCARPGG